jgi:hypothetical protein
MVKEIASLRLCEFFNFRKDARAQGCLGKQLYSYLSASIGFNSAAFLAG